jgi:uncharacterized protein (TIGR02001 family)
VDSEYRLRGHATSARDPVATINLNYDDHSGVYAGGLLVVTLTGSELEPVAVLANLGYARRVTPGLALDIGLLRTELRSPTTPHRRAHYTELYLGLAQRTFSARVFLSPDYLGPDNVTGYGEINAVVPLTGGLRLKGHVGSLTFLSRPPPNVSRTHYDWRIGLSQQVGRFDLSVAGVGGGPGRDYYGGRLRSRTRLVAGAAWLF